MMLLLLCVVCRFNRGEAPGSPEKIFLGWRLKFGAEFKTTAKDQVTPTSELLQQRAKE
jgi:hypothetical protein